MISEKRTDVIYQAQISYKGICERPDLNKYLEAERSSNHSNGHSYSPGNDMKRMWQDEMAFQLQKQLKITFEVPVWIHYRIYEPNRRKDRDNVSATAMKYLQDTLVEMGVLRGDGAKHVIGFDHLHYIDKDHPRIEVLIETLSEQEVKDIETPGMIQMERVYVKKANA
ncbi:hypothetical protein M2146_001163 [Lachnospiraceae bacterium PF1-22]